MSTVAMLRSVTSRRKLSASWQQSKKLARRRVQAVATSPASCQIYVEHSVVLHRSLARWRSSKSPFTRNSMCIRFPFVEMSEQRLSLSRASRAQYEQSVTRHRAEWGLTLPLVAYIERETLLRTVGQGIALVCWYVFPRAARPR